MRVLIPNNMTMSEIHRYCEDKAKRREAKTAKLNAKLDEIQKQIDNALATIDKEINDKVDK